MDILLKHTPKYLKDVVSNKLQIQKIRSCLQEGQCVLILGPPGSGKSLISGLVCKENNANVLIVCKDSLSQVDHFLKSGTIDSFFDKRKKMLVFDNVDTMLQNDKLSISYLQDVIKQSITSNICVIITCNSNEEKKILDVKKAKNVETVRIGFPLPKETFAYLMRVLDTENIEYDPEEILKMSVQYNGNIRETINQICHGNDQSDVQNFRNLNIFEMTNAIFKAKLTMQQAKYLSNDDANVISCMFFENLPEEIHMNRAVEDTEAAIKLYKDILKTYIDSTLIEDYMCRNHEWNLWDLIYMLRFYGGSARLHSCERKEKPKEFTLRMSQLLSKISHKQIMNKRLKSVSEGVSYENKLWIAELARHGYSEKERKTKFNADEANFINTYHKYFP